MPAEWERCNRGKLCEEDICKKAVVVEMMKYGVSYSAINDCIHCDKW